MNLDQLLLEDSQRVEEKLRDIAAAGALAAALSAGPAQASNNLPGVMQAPAGSSSSVQPAASHPNFPGSLMGLQQVDPRTRVDAFIHTMLPLIQQANRAIASDRQRLQRILRETNRTAEQTAWLQEKIDLYDARDERDLLSRMDTVPPSLVLAQAAIESGWGTDKLAVQHNNFFGQRTWGSAGVSRTPRGERYANFASPRASINSYMRNLNTHRAYQQFRQERARARSRGREPYGIDLAGTLQNYSTRGQDYVAQVQRLIRSRNLQRFDRDQP